MTRRPRHQGAWTLCYWNLLNETILRFSFTARQHDWMLTLLLSPQIFPSLPQRLPLPSPSLARVTYSRLRLPLLDTKFSTECMYCFRNRAANGIRRKKKNILTSFIICHVQIVIEKGFSCLTFCARFSAIKASECWTNDRIVYFRINAIVSSHTSFDSVLKSCPKMIQVDFGISQLIYTHRLCGYCLGGIDQSFGLGI